MKEINVSQYFIATLIPFLIQGKGRDMQKTTY